MSLRIHELNHVALHVRDLAASEKFYGEILELPRLPRPAFSFPGAWFSLGAQELHLIAEPGLDLATRRHHHFALRVDDAFAAREALSRKGVTEFRGPAPRPDGPMQLFILDPDGYSLELFDTRCWDSG